MAVDAVLELSSNGVAKIIESAIVRGFSELTRAPGGPDMSQNIGLLRIPVPASIAPGVVSDPRAINTYLALMGVSVRVLFDDAQPGGIVADVRVREAAFMFRLLGARRDQRAAIGDTFTLRLPFTISGRRSGSAFEVYANLDTTDRRIDLFGNFRITTGVPGDWTLASVRARLLDVLARFGTFLGGSPSRLGGVIALRVASVDLPLVAFRGFALQDITLAVRTDATIPSVVLAGSLTGAVGSVDLVALGPSTLWPGHDFSIRLASRVSVSILANLILSSLGVAPGSPEVVVDGLRIRYRPTREVRLAGFDAEQLSLDIVVQPETNTIEIDFSVRGSTRGREATVWLALQSTVCPRIACRAPLDSYPDETYLHLPNVRVDRLNASWSYMAALVVLPFAWPWLAQQPAVRQIQRAIFDLHYTPIRLGTFTRRLGLGACSSGSLRLGAVPDAATAVASGAARVGRATLLLGQCLSFETGQVSNREAMGSAMIHQCPPDADVEFTDAFRGARTAFGDALTAVGGTRLQPLRDPGAPAGSDSAAELVRRDWTASEDVVPEEDVPVYVGRPGMLRRLPVAFRTRTNRYGVATVYQRVLPLPARGVATEVDYVIYDLPVPAVDLSGGVRPMLERRLTFLSSMTVGGVVRTRWSVETLAAFVARPRNLTAPVRYEWFFGGIALRGAGTLTRNGWSFDFQVVENRCVMTGHRGATFADELCVYVTDSRDTEVRQCTRVTMQGVLEF